MHRNRTTITFLLAILAILQTCHSFIIATKLGFRKCYYSDVSHDKTLNVKFGFPRREKENCKFGLEINYLRERGFADQQGQQPSEQEKDVKLYSGEFFCYEMSPRQPYIYKHTPSKHEYSGSYQICVQNLQDFNPGNNTMFQLQIEQKFDPTLMVEGVDIPLVGSTQIIEFEGIVMEIKRILSKCNMDLKSAEEVGYELVKILKESSELNQRATVIQIIGILVYGVLWVLAIRRIRKD